jgi:DNA transformation protein
VADVFFPDYVLEQLAAFGGVSARRMFGGSGLFKSGVMFGLISDGELFFKVDDANRADYKAKKSEPFTYEARGRKIALSYWFVPEDIIEEPDELRAWAAKAYDAALKSRKDDAAKPKARRRSLSGTPSRRRR